MRGPTDAHEERRASAERSPLAALARQLGRTMETWLDVALEPLPETFRISLHRSDRDWTVEQVKALGAVPLPWMPDETGFSMPFARGRAPEGLAQRLMALLHETGRITRQEAASMLPVRLLELKSNSLALDMCAAPGSKTTHMGERLHPNGVVVANEPVSGRLNMLVSNRSRLALTNVVVTNTMGGTLAAYHRPGSMSWWPMFRHGYGNESKNRDVWWDWTPRRPQDVRHAGGHCGVGGLTLIPGGELMYSTRASTPLRTKPWWRVFASLSLPRAGSDSPRRSRADDGRPNGPCSMNRGTRKQRGTPQPAVHSTKPSRPQPARRTG